MHQSQSRGEIGIREVGEEATQLPRCEHTFIYNILARERADVEIVVVDAIFDAFAHLVEHAFEHGHIFIAHAGDEELLYVGLHLACAHARHIVGGGHCAQVHQCEPFALHFFDDDGEYLALACGIFRQKHYAGAVFAFLGHRNALQENKLVRNLQQDAGSVAGLVAGLCSAVLHVLEHSQRIVDQSMALVAIDVYHHAHATCVVLVTFIIQSFYLFHCFAEFLFVISVFFLTNFCKSRKINSNM